MVYLLKIFVSYSTHDSRALAEIIDEHFTDLGYKVFVSSLEIPPSDFWNPSIDNNLSQCNIFLILVTKGALDSREVEKEFLEARRLKKHILMCRYSEIDRHDLKWGLDKMEELEFTSQDSLLKGLYKQIYDIAKNSNKLVVSDSSKLQKDISDQYSFIRKWIMPKCHAPEGIAVDLSNNIYVCDSSNNCVMKYDKTGDFVTGWGSEGKQQGQFDEPTGIAVDSFGYVYVTDVGNNRIQKFDNNGRFIQIWDFSSDQLELNGDRFVQDDLAGHLEKRWVSREVPMAVDADKHGNIYTAHIFLGRIKKYDNIGGLIKEWGSEGKGLLKNPAGIAVTPWGDVYVADIENSRICRYNNNGGFITSWGSPGTGYGEFFEPGALGVDGWGDVYVVESDRIQKFDSIGRFITSWGSKGSSDGQFGDARDIAVDSSGYVYVTDSINTSPKPQSGKTIDIVRASASYQPSKGRVQVFAKS